MRLKKINVVKMSNWILSGLENSIENRRERGGF